MALNQGQTINNRYRIAKRIGQGGFGAVYRAWDTAINRVCALKENLDTSSEAQRQFQREATMLGNLQHPNLPRVTDYFFIPGQGQYLVMDFVEGQSLDDILGQKGRPLTEQEALPWIEQVCQALEYLHSRTPAVIHRDLKPQNILITPDSRAMLVDFGISKVYDPQLSTTAGARAITPGFSPVEQYGMSGRTDARSDVYALAATLYNLLTDQAPPEATDRLTQNTPLAPLRQFNPYLQPALEQAVLKAMEITPDRRFQSVRDFHAAITDRSPVRSPSLPAQTQPTSFWQQSGRFLGVGLALLLFLGGLSGVIVYNLMDPSAPTPTPVKSIIIETPLAGVMQTASPLPPAPLTLATWTPTATPAPALIWTPTNTPLPPAIWTPTATPAPASTWTPTNTPFIPAPPTQTDTPVPHPPPPEYLVPRPPGRFGDIWESLGGAAGPLGLPGEIISERNYSRQYFADGFMFWWDNPADPDYIWVVNGNSDSGTDWTRYTDTWTAAESPYPPACPDAHEPNGPRNGFGKLWCQDTTVKNRFGPAAQPESGSGDVYEKAILQFFSGGVIFYVPADQKIWALLNDGQWQKFNP